MIGSRIGSKGAVYGPAVGSSSDDEGGSASIPGVTRDSSNIYTPSSAAEWTTFLAAVGLSGTVGVPSALWLFQDAAGNPVDTIGGFTLTQAGTVPTYQSSVAGWSRKCILLADGASTSLSSVAAGLPDLLTNSFISLGYINMPAAAPAGVRNVLSQGTIATPAFYDIINGTGVPRCKSGANTADGASNPCTGAVRPVVVQHNFTASSMLGADNLQKVTPAFGVTSTGKRVDWGTAANFVYTGGPLYGCSWFNAAAEMSSATIKSLLTALGWSIPWS